jgi:C-methyltransferase
MSTLTLDKAQLAGLSSVISAALGSGLLDAVPLEPTPAEVIARQAGTDPRVSKLVLEALAAFGIFQKDGDRYFASAQMRAWATATPGGLSAERMVWERLPQALATGKATERGDDSSQARAALYRQVVADLGAMWAASAEALAEKLPPCGPAVLDVGCGSGVWSLALARRRPELFVTGVDLPEVVPAFSERARTLTLSDRTAVRGVDIHTDDPPPGRFDLVVVANLLRLESGSTAQALLRRLAKALKPSGAFLIIDAFAGGGVEHERWRALYALHLAMRTEQGEVHSRERVTGWLRELGAVTVETLEVPPAPGAVGALFARMP